MTPEADQTGRARAPLPDIHTYLRSVYEIGRQSLRPALPALAFLFLGLVGMGAYGALTNYTYGIARGTVDAKAVMHNVDVQAAMYAAPLLLLALVYIPFLPLQESLFRGNPNNLLEAIRRVLRAPLNLLLSLIAQVFILLSPISPFFFNHLLPGAFWELAWNFLALTLYALCAWLLITPFFLMFAMPAVVLDGEGPLHSLRTSCNLAWKNLGSALGRLLTVGILAIVAYMVVTIPSSMLNAAGRASGVAATPIKLAAVIWSSAASTLFLPFGAAAVLVLYRTLRPWADEGRD